MGSWALLDIRLGRGALLMWGLVTVSCKSSTWMLNMRAMSRPPCVAKARRVLQKLDVDAEYEGNAEAIGKWMLNMKAMSRPQEKIIQRNERTSRGDRRLFT